MDLQSDRVVLRKVLYLDIKWVKEEITIREIVYTCSTSLRRGLVSSSVWTTYGLLFCLEDWAPFPLRFRTYCRVEASDAWGNTNS